ncbi:hypothetical protein HZA97_00680 [Candidatus Woesearchaeota archaeon]|nr:hypothetical protein [Candidatus Woesearchaeota archaeon]
MTNGELRMTKDIESRIDELKKQAGRKNIGQKAYLIARELGESNNPGLDFENSNRRSKKFFENGNLRVSFGANCDVLVQYKSETVFYTDLNYELKCYKTGHWERLLNRFYNKAREASLVRQAKEETELKEANELKLSEKAKCFGLE